MKYGKTWWYMSTIIKSPWVTGGLIVCVHFHRCRHHSSANTFQLSRNTPEANSFKPHMVNLWVWEKFLAPISVTLGQVHWATEVGQNLVCPSDKLRTAHPNASKHGRYIFLFMVSTWLNFGGILPNILFLAKKFHKISNPFFLLSNILLAIS